MFKTQSLANFVKDSKLSKFEFLDFNINFNFLTAFDKLNKNNIKFS